MNSAIDLSGPSVDAVLPNPLIEPQVTRTYQVAKRVLDICGALVGLAVLALMLPIIALLIVWEDHGPIFYRQIRVGQYSHPFYIYKLRSMRVDADGYLKEHPDLLAAWHRNGKLRNDPRITRIGRFIRSHGLDELPQMLNVLRGEMSLVGPRAIQFSEVAAFGEFFELRQMAKPGLTSLLQISDRSMASYEWRCVIDSIYVMNRSLWMDICIMIKTFSVVIRGVGAY